MSELKIKAVIEHMNEHYEMELRRISEEFADGFNVQFAKIVSLDLDRGFEIEIGESDFDVALDKYVTTTRVVLVKYPQPVKSFKQLKPVLQNMVLHIREQMTVEPESYLVDQKRDCPRRLLTKN